MTSRVEKPWGHEEIWAETASYVGKILVIRPGEKLSRQYHNLKEETFRVLTGDMTLELGADASTSLSMGPGDVYHCSPGTVHRMCAGSHGCTVVEVSTPHLDDVVRIEDDYGRKSWRS